MSDLGRTDFMEQLMIALHQVKMGTYSIVTVEYYLKYLNELSLVFI